MLITLARKPLTGSVASNVLAHGVGALNVEECRVKGGAIASAGGSRRSGGIMGASEPLGGWEPTHLGRWPANVLLDEKAAKQMDYQGGIRPSTMTGRIPAGQVAKNPGISDPTVSMFGVGVGVGGGVVYSDTGGASRYFKQVKSC